MTDYCSPMVSLSKNEVDSYWLFQSVMKKYSGLFSYDEKMVNEKLKMLQFITRKIDPELYFRLKQIKQERFIFCYRWILVCFKRELKTEDFFIFWDKLFTNYLTCNFEVFLAFAIVQQNRKQLMSIDDDVQEIMFSLTKNIKNFKFETLIKQATAYILQLSQFVNIKK